MTRPVINITEAMLNLMAEEPRKVIDLADLLSCSPQQVIARLRRLERDRKAQRQRVNNTKGFYYAWHVAVPGRILPTIQAEAPATPDYEEDDAPGIGEPVRKFVSTWAPNHVRGDIETYLFGLAQREAA